MLSLHNMPWKKRKPKPSCHSFCYGYNIAHLVSWHVFSWLLKSFARVQLTTVITTGGLQSCKNTQNCIQDLCFWTLKTFAHRLYWPLTSPCGHKNRAARGRCAWTSADYANDKNDARWTVCEPQQNMDNWIILCAYCCHISFFWNMLLKHFS